jgi:hypothetical protein
MRVLHWILLLAVASLSIGCQERPLDASDTDPPSAITDLTVDRPLDTTLHLSWTSSGDDGETGTAALYEIRYSTQDLSDANALNRAAAVFLPIENRRPQRVDLSLGNLERGRTYFFRVRAGDEVPNWSPWSNVATANSFNTPPDLIVELARDSLVLGDTLVVDASGTRDAENENLEFRWDWDGDGTWDTPWSGERIVRHVPQRIGRYSLIAEVRDEIAVSSQEVPLVVAGFVTRSRRSLVTAQASGTCCGFNCQTCDMGASDSSATSSASFLERSVSFPHVRAHTLQRVEDDEEAIHVAVELETFLDNGRNTCLARATTATEIEIFARVNFETRVQWSLPAQTASGTWSLTLAGPAGTVVASSGDPAVDHDHEIETGVLEPGVYTFTTEFEVGSTSTVLGGFDLQLGTGAQAGEGAP